MTALPIPLLTPLATGNDVTTTWRFSYGELRKNKVLADMVGFKDTHYREGRIIDDEELWEGTVTKSAQWDPYRYCPEEVTKRLKPLWC